jgi:hypothetical protein
MVASVLDAVAVAARCGDTSVAPVALAKVSEVRITNNSNSAATRRYEINIPSRSFLHY